MSAMRAFVAAALVLLVLVVAGCGGGGSAGLARGASLGSDASQLVPPDASAFAAVDTNLTSAQWQRVDDLTKSFPARAKLLDDIRNELQKRSLTWKADVAPALGAEVDLAVFGTGGKAEYVAFAKPDDVAKLRALATKLSTGADQYTVEQIGGWSVVADSKDLFDRVRAAQSGRSLADVAAFTAAWSRVGGDSLARAYVSGDAIASKSSSPGEAKADWFAARVAADGNALRLDIAKHPRVATAAPTKQTLLGDVPSGATLAVAFHGEGDLLKGLSSTKLAVRVLKQLAPVLTGDGVLYVRPSGLIPDLALEVTPKDPQAALAAAKTLLQSLTGKLGLVPLTAELSGNKLVIADGPSASAALRGGSKLVDDATYRDAVKSAGVPAQTSFLVYADVTQLTPFIQLVAQALGKHSPDQAYADNLAHVGTLVAWGSKSGGVTGLHAWVQPH
jgi:hypothetical protein